MTFKQEFIELCKKHDVVFDVSVQSTDNRAVYLFPANDLFDCVKFLWHDDETEMERVLDCIEQANEYPRWE